LFQFSPQTQDFLSQLLDGLLQLADLLATGLFGAGTIVRESVRCWTLAGAGIHRR